MFSGLRQLKYPKEFRISEPLWPQDIWESTEQIVSLILSPPQEDKGLHRLLKEIGTGLWRVRNRLLGEANPSLEVRGALRFLQATWDSLEQSGLEIHDHDNEFVTGGESLRIVAFEPSDRVSRNQVIETIKPTIYYNGTIVQVGEVIVGTPKTSSDAEARRELVSSLK